MGPSVPVTAQCEVHLSLKSSLKHQMLWQVLLQNHKVLGEQKCQLRRQCTSHYRRHLNYAKGATDGKAIPAPAWTGPEGFRRWDSQISKQSAHEVGKVFSPTYRPPLSPEDVTGTHVC